MTDKKFTDEEIIKALECCADTASAREMFFTYQGIPLRYLFADTLDLINRQKAEVERLNKTLSEQFDSYENIRKKAKAEAIEEFFEKAKDKLHTCLYADGIVSYAFDITDLYEVFKELTDASWDVKDQIAKELTEGKK